MLLPFGNTKYNISALLPIVNIFVKYVLPFGNSSGIVLIERTVFDMSLGDFMKEKRKQKNWSQRDLASASGISNAEISRLEAGKRKEPSPSVLREIAKSLDVPIEELLQEAGIIEKGKEYVKQKATFSVFSNSSSTNNAVIPSDLTPDEIQDVMHYIDFIRSKRK